MSSKKKKKVFRKIPRSADPRTKARVTWAELSARLGRNDLPLRLLKGCRKLSRAELAKGISASWVGAEYPIKFLSIDLWMFLFGLALAPGQFIDEDTIKPADSALPSSIILYRGAVPKYRRSMSWTSRFDTALWFAKRSDLFGLGPSHVYRVTVPRSLVLAKFHEGRNEAEYVVDANRLTNIQEVEAAQYSTLLTVS